MSDTVKYNLDENGRPRQWYNIGVKPPVPPPLGVMRTPGSSFVPPAYHTCGLRTVRA